MPAFGSIASSALLFSIFPTLFANPVPSSNDPATLTVTLRYLDVGVNDVTVFNQADLPQSKAPQNSQALYTIVNLETGAQVSSEKFTCQVRDLAGEPIAVVRDSTFADFEFTDGGKGGWTFLEGPQQVSQVYCWSG